MKTTRKIYDEQGGFGESLYGWLDFTTSLSGICSVDIKMDKLRVEIEPQIVCRCGKILPMSEKERREYDAVIREIEERQLEYAKLTGDESKEGIIVNDACQLYTRNMR